MRNWQNILIKILWSILGAALIVLFVIAWKAKVTKKITHIQVELVGETTTALFMDEKEITQILKDQGIAMGTVLEGVNLTQIEKNLEKIRWIKNAELFTDNQQVLEVKIEQRKPIARVFTLSGSSFYIDNEGWRLPLKQLTVLRLPIFTGFPTDQDKLSTPDSTLLNDILTFSNTIIKDSFFTAQIAQINIEPNGDFQFIPSLGDHLVLIGSVDNLEDKLNRLYTFYKRVWVQSGINAYQVLDCRFDQQIVALKKGMQPVQYTPGILPFQKSILLDERKDSISAVVVTKIVKDTVVSPLKKVKETVKKEKETVKKKGDLKLVKVKKIGPIKNNKQNNKSLIIKKKSAKALMPAKIDSKTTTTNN
ncbi:MAG: cell division protein FtsQ/DivIB [Bacteroidetes bacterium]|nr:cell division protein FtsQ/DivIB [Bacteroidota bacterium]